MHRHLCRPARVVKYNDVDDDDDSGCQIYKSMQKLFKGPMG